MNAGQRAVTKFWHRLDDLYMKPLFGGSTETNARRIRRTAAALHDDPDADRDDALWPSDHQSQSLRSEEEEEEEN